MISFFLPISFFLIFVIGKVGALLLYQETWKTGIERQFHPWGALLTFLKRPWPWIAHIPIFTLSCFMSWDGLPGLKIFTCVAAGAFTISAIGRWGAVDLRWFFIFDRVLVLIFWLGLWVSPIFLYPLLLACCCLQYIISGSALSPGYSNLLGFEFMRSSLFMMLGSLLLQASLRLLSQFEIAYHIANSEIEVQTLALILCGQAASYVAQALAKFALGEKWYSWIQKNRVQCLVVNAYLRGWGAAWIKATWALGIARFIGQSRMLLCAVVLITEFSWVLILLKPHLAIGILIATIFFHLVVWLLTGLAGYHYIISHGLMILLITGSFTSSSTSEIFVQHYLCIGVCSILIYSVWVLFLRRQLFCKYTKKENLGGWARLIDPSDHLMSWWDGPYMRMYSYSVTTTSGHRFHFPVTKFSPYDTFVTDIHTHLMILGRQFELDANLDADRTFVRTGVWGLTVSISDRNRLYNMMDQSSVDYSLFKPNVVVEMQTAVTQDANSLLKIGNSSHIRDALISFFQGINHYQLKWWFRFLLIWPHFPGEDMVSDCSPFANERLPNYRGSEPVTEVIIHCIKTFYRGDKIECIDNQVIARLPIPLASIRIIP